MLTKIKKFFTSMNEEKIAMEESVLTDSKHNSNIITDTKSDNSEKTESVELTDLKSDLIKDDKSNSGNKDEPTLEEVKEEVIKVLKTCYDPEIPVDVWELGLIYDIKVATNKDVLVIMTLTSPSCPVAGILPGEIEQKIKEHPMVNDCKVQLTFDPPWGQNMMSEVAKLELGFL